ncbi:MAG: sugar MFS transporter [Pseudomonadales bacterium]|nr:sugar MFS transporter [Pseudomonadales bacterium]
MPPVLNAQALPEPNHRPALMLLSSLFFMWGFMTSLNDILIPHLRNAFTLNYTQSMLVQFCFFGAYFIVSIPAGRLISRVGYHKGLVVGLLLAALGCLVFYPAAGALSYPLFLGALFILAAGITVLQVSANPYVTALGDPATAASRLTLTQAFNSLGTAVAPFLGGIVILGAVAPALLNDGSAVSVAEQARTVQMPYVYLGLLFIVLALIFARARLPVPDIESRRSEHKPTETLSAWSYPHLRLGAVAIFVYVGAEVGIGSFLINFLGEADVAAMAQAQAATYVSYYWGGAMLGRFVGALLMRRFDAGQVLGYHALLALGLVSIAIVGQGHLAMWALIGVGLFNSIMFPTIFSLALRGLHQCSGQGSGILCLAIVGGAVLPVAQGALADLAGIRWGFILPGLCYLYILFYGWRGAKI